MAGLASYYNPETRGNPYCEGCGTRHWSTLTNCAHCEAELCSECGVEQEEERRSAEVWLCGTCASKCAAEKAEVALEAEQPDADPGNLREVRENRMVGAEVRVAPERAERMEMKPHWDAGVA